MDKATYKYPRFLHVGICAVKALLLMAMFYACGCSGVFELHGKIINCKDGQTKNAAGVCKKEEAAAILPLPAGAFVIAGPTSPVSIATPVVTWSAASNAAFYNVDIGKTADCSPSLQAHHNISATSVTLGTLYKNTYYVCVSAVTSEGSITLASNNGYRFDLNLPPTWSAQTATQSLIQGDALAVTMTASDPDPGASVIYAFDQTNMNCQSQNWSPNLSINAQTGLISGTISSIADVTTCSIAVKATSDSTSISQTFSVILYPPAPGGFTCDSGNLRTTCYINSTKLLANAAILAGPGNLVLQNSGNLTSNALESIAVKMGSNVTIQNGGKISANLSTLNATNITIDSGGSIDVTGKGYVGAVGNTTGGGPGGGVFAVTDCGGGGSYGGYGGWGCYVLSSAPNPYGSNTAPVDFGSGGGGAPATNGGNGGGAVKLNASATLTINGSILSQGTAGTDNGFRGAGGGSGGSIWLIGSVFTGSGSINADGGAGAMPGAGGGGGAGGRISLSTTTYVYTGTISAEGNAIVNIANAGSYYAAISNICDSGSLATNCIVSSTKILGIGSAISGTGNLVIANSGVLKIYPNIWLATPGSISLAMANDIEVQNGGILRGNFSITSKNFTVASGGLVDGQGSGFGSWYGPGAGGYSAGGDCGGGASHGGAGGDGCYDPDGSLVIYGIKTSPETFGSGGGVAGYSVFGGAGGGAIKISTTNVLQVDGTITADGNVGLTTGFRGAGGGSGGSIWLIGSTVKGAGTIRAQGGNGGDLVTQGGGGGGGRIDIDFSNYLFTGTVSVNPASIGTGVPTVGTFCLNGGGC